MALKTLVKSALQKFGVDVVRYVPEFERPFPVLPLLVREHLARHGRLQFVQVGANDGVLDDSLRALILEHRLPGLLIEPQPHVFEQLRRNYPDQPGLVFENVAVATEDGTRTIYCVAAGAPLPADLSRLASFDKSHLVKEGVPERYVEPRTVPAMRLSTLLAKHGIETVDLLCVDVEGYDYHIVRSALESGLFPALINYEHCHLPPRDRLSCKQLLDKHGYSFLEVGKDTLAVRRA